MATGGSDETFEFICTPCCKESEHVEAVVYCVDCKECLCETCFNLHQRFAAMVVHKVLDQAGMQAGGVASMTSLPTDTCDTHAGKLIVVYCEDHDAMCCVECVSTDHRSCSATVYIPVASGGIKESALLNDTLMSITYISDKARKMQISRQREIKETKHDKRDIIADIQKATDGLVKRIKQLGQVSLDIVNTSYDPVEHALDDEIDCVDKIITYAQLEQATISSSNVSDAQLFINEIRARRHFQDLGKELDDVKGNRVCAKRVFLKKLEMSRMLNSLNEIESLISYETVYTLKLYGKYNIKVSADTNKCYSLASCLLPDGTVMITDWENKRLKRIDAAYRVTGYDDMPCEPWGVTCTSSDEVAVTLTQLKQVQFVSVRDPISKTKSFSTSDRCRGICYSIGELFISCGGMTTDGWEEGPGHVSVYDLNGAHLRSIQTDQFGQQVFHCPYHITASSNGARIYVAHSAGVVSSDRTGEHIGYIKDPSLQHAIGVCTLNDGHILVSGLMSHNVLQFDSDFRKVAELVKDTKCIKEPNSVLYDRDTSMVIVTLSNDDKIEVFYLI